MELDQFDYSEKETLERPKIGKYETGGDNKMTLKQPVIRNYKYRTQYFERVQRHADEYDTELKETSYLPMITYVVGLAASLWILWYITPQSIKALIISIFKFFTA